jgi:hypothetical protein
MVAVIGQKIPHVEDHRRFIPLTYDNLYNCELCGFRTALLKVTTSTANDQEQFNVCGTCLKEYNIDQQAAEKK